MRALALWQALKSCGALTQGGPLALWMNHNSLYSKLYSIIVAIAVDVNDAWCRAEAPTLRMSSGQLSIAFPVRKGIPPAVVKREIRMQMKSLCEASGDYYTEVGPEALPCGSAWMMSLQQF